MKRKILIIAPYQFGELSDCYYWAKYATIEGWTVTYIGYKYKHSKIKERSFLGVRVKSVWHIHNKFFLGLIFYLRCILEIVCYRHQNIIICRMPYCELLPKLFPFRNIILDVRTLSVSPDAEVRNKQDSELSNIKKYFKECSVITEGVGEKLGRPYKILPLGAEIISEVPKKFDFLRLFYIGTFDNRKLNIFIQGLAKFQQMTGIKTTFDIIGGGIVNTQKELEKEVVESGAKNINFHGYLNHDEAKFFFDNCNVGVCFVPVTDYYQYQPPTKLYEYLLSGMACISTCTYSNVKVMTEQNGIVISDTSESVCEGLVKLHSKLATFRSSVIVSGSMQYNWKGIVENNLLPLMK